MALFVGVAENSTVCKCEIESLDYPFCFGYFPVLVHISYCLQGLPDLMEQSFSDLVFGTVNLPSTHVAYLVFGPKKVFIG